jgi:hypothetical protein
MPIKEEAKITRTLVCDRCGLEIQFRINPQSGGILLEPHEKPPGKLSKVIRLASGARKADFGPLNVSQENWDEAVGKKPEKKKRKQFFKHVDGTK